MKLLTVIGARPQFIKAGSVSREIIKKQDLKEVIVHTGQHYDANMSDVFFHQMQIPKPDYFLGIGGKSHGAMTGQMIEKLESVAVKESPDWIMVYGDTNSTLAGAIVASKLHIKLAHVEAGLRSFNMRMPEEVNRVLTDRISTVLFCPTYTAIDNLKNEGFDKFDCDIINTGDVMKDSAMFYKPMAIKPDVEISKPFILATVHRAENTNDIMRIKSIFNAFERIAEKKQILLPLHPRTKKILADLKLKPKNITLIEPVGYLQMIWLLNRCELVITDSGGLQKEAFFFERPCITLRDETEWIELTENNVNIIVGANEEKIIQAFEKSSLLKSESFSKNLYGDGSASKKIANYLSQQ